MRRFIAVILIVLSATAAQASDWYKFGHGTDGSVWWADRETSLGDETFRWVWVKSDLAKVKGTKIGSSKELWRYNCKERTSLVVSVIEYLPNGNVHKSQSFPSDNKYLYSPVAPGTLSDTVMQDICFGVAS